MSDYSEEIVDRSLEMLTLAVHGDWELLDALLLDLDTTELRLLVKGLAALTSGALIAQMPDDDRAWLVRFCAAMKEGRQ